MNKTIPSWIGQIHRGKKALITLISLYNYIEQWANIQDNIYCLKTNENAQWIDIEDNKLNIRRRRLSSKTSYFDSFSKLVEPFELIIISCRLNNENWKKYVLRTNFRGNSRNLTIFTSHEETIFKSSGLCPIRWN